jgi:hypothetical protein
VMIGTDCICSYKSMRSWWRVSEASESQTSYSVEQADIFQYQSYLLI